MGKARQLLVFSPTLFNHIISTDPRSIISHPDPRSCPFKLEDITTCLSNMRKTTDPWVLMIECLGILLYSKCYTIVRETVVFGYLLLRRSTQ